MTPPATSDVPLATMGLTVLTHIHFNVYLGSNTGPGRWTKHFLISMTTPMFSVFNIPSASMYLKMCMLE